MGATRAAVSGSIAVHALLGALALALAPHGDRATMPAPLAIEVIDAPIVAPPAVTPPMTPRGELSGSRKARSSRSAQAPRSKATSAFAELATIRAESAGDGEGGAGTGAGHGSGIGLGDGGSIAPPPASPRPPPPPEVVARPASKARPARLIYPAREREVEDAQLFVMRVTVDADGYVAGARLVRGFGGTRDDQASALIWKFRYAPALDDSGRAVASTLDQRFLVNR